MATNFGFMPVLKGKRYFISYKSEDTARVGEITRRLNQMGVPMWYDYGIEKGENWSDEINRNIEECEAFILFATRKLFAAEDTWVRKEFRLASMSKKKKYVVWLDDLNPYENPNDVHSKLKAWFVDVDDLQGIRMAGKTVEHIAWSMVTEFHLIQGKKPQPPSPTYQQPVKSPSPAPRLNVQVGGKVQFGQYPQRANGEVQPIEWRVLAVENGRALLITDRLIDCVKYNEERVDVTWETCTLRKWMNSDFISKAFNSSEQAQIATVTNRNPDNPNGGFFGHKRINGGNATQDRIFALSIDEAKKYFRDDDDRMAAPTGYAKKTGVTTGWWWWLRSPGIYCNVAAIVLGNGIVDHVGGYVNRDGCAVRPAFWLKL